MTKRIAVALLLVGCASDDITPFATLDGSGGAQDAPVTQATGGATNALGGAVTASGGAVVGSGGTVAQGGTMSSGGAPGAGGTFQEPRCDWIPTCAGETYPCSTSYTSTVGSCRVGRFICGTETGWIVDTASFPCAVSGTSIDCAGALRSVSDYEDQHCLQGTGGAASGGAPGIGGVASGGDTGGRATGGTMAAGGTTVRVTCQPTLADTDPNVCSGQFPGGCEGTTFCRDDTLGLRYCSSSTSTSITCTLCQSGRLDCNGKGSDGCETPRTDANCAWCGDACKSPKYCRQAGSLGYSCQ